MGAKLDIAGQHMDVSPELQKYVAKKIGGLDRYAPKAARESMRVEVKLRETRAKDKQQFHCTAVMHLPHENLEAGESTVNMFAAIDIVEEHLKAQLRKYKQTHADAKRKRRLFARRPRGTSE